jgi:hypothetical protein
MSFHETEVNISAGQLFALQAHVNRNPNICTLSIFQNDATGEIRVQFVGVHNAILEEVELV